MKTIHVGETVNLQMYATGNDIRALNIEASFNPSVLDFTSVILAGNFSQENSALVPTDNAKFFASFSNATNNLKDLINTTLGVLTFQGIAPGICDIILTSKSVQKGNALDDYPDVQLQNPDQIDVEDTIVETRIIGIRII